MFLSCFFSWNLKVIDAWRALGFIHVTDVFFWVFFQVEAEEESMADNEVTPLLPVDIESQMAFVRSAILDVSGEVNQNVKQILIDRFAALQDRHIQMIKSLDGNQFTLEQVC